MGDKKKKQEKIMKVKKKNFILLIGFAFYTGRMYCAANLKWTKEEEKEF